MLKVENIRLKSQLLLLVCLSIAIIVTLQVVYLSWFGLINKRNYSDFLNDTLKQLEVKAAAFLTEINTIANITSFNEVTYRFVSTKDIDEQLRLRNNMQVMIESILLSNKSIEDIIITDLDLVSIGANRSESFWVLNEIKKRVQAGTIRMDRPTHYLLDGHISGKTFYVCVTRSFVAPDATDRFLTVLVYNTDSFVQIVSSIQPNDHSIFMILNAANQPIAVNRPVEAQTTAEALRAAAGLTDDKNSLVSQRAVPQLNWSIIGYTPDVEIVKDLSALKQFGFLTGGIVIAVLLGFGLIINKSFTAPITRMARFMNSIGHNYSAQRLAIHSSNEISLLARTLNRMLDNIDAMNRKVVSSQEKLYKAELAKKHAQFAAFQSQVNPHFLYNTLDCIRSIALTRDVPEIFDITTAMAKIFRYSIKENNDVRVGDELECMRDYFKIIQIRQGNRFRIECRVGEDIMQAIIPKMILQPIVENAIFHGLEQKKGEGTLSIRGRAVADGILQFEIEDDGKGMSEEMLHELRRHIAAWDPLEETPAVMERKSLGLLNIDRRIKLLYGKDFGLSIDSGLRDGTRVTILLPAARQNRKSSDIAKMRTFK